MLTDTKVNKDNLKEVTYLLSKHKRISFKDKQNILSKVPELFDILNNLSLLQINIILSYYEVNQHFPKCKICQKEFIKFRSLNFNKTCSKQCSKILTSVTSKNTWNKLTTHQKHIIQQNKENGCLRKYGVSNVSKLETIREKISKKALLKTDEEKLKILQKRKGTTTLLYGSEYVSQVTTLKEKAKQTCLEKYGVDNAAKSEVVKEKSKQTCQVKYKVNYWVQSEVYKDNIKKQFYETTILSYLQKYNLILLEPYIGKFECSKKSFKKIHKKYHIRCISCNKTFNSTLLNNNESCCPKCNPVNRSSQEKELASYLETKINEQEIIYNSRKILDTGKEIDIFIKSFKLGIEIHGLYYHAAYSLDTFKLLKTYHLDKYLNASIQNIKLLQFFENELHHKKEICYSIINANLSINQSKIFARKCSIQIVSNKESKDFLTSNHIQGYINSSINLGLFYENNLVQLMTFGHSRFNKKYSYELIRLCSKLNTQVLGGTEKLFKHFKENYLKPQESIISYCDNRFFNGLVYSKLNFKFLHETQPNYFYWKNGSLMLESRQKYQKHKLKELLKNFDSSKTEIENMFNHGYRVLFDCGNKVFVYR